MSKRGKRKKFGAKKIISVICIITIAAGGFIVYKKQQEKKLMAMSDGQVAVDIVTRGDIEVLITGEASVEPYERYEIISMVSGDILTSPYDVGDQVKEGDILYQFDTSSAEINIQKQELSLEQSKRSLQNAKEDLQEAQSKLVVTAENSGIISGMTIKNGSSVSNNEKIATIENTTDMEVTVPFSKSQIDKMYVGQTATVSSSAHMSSVNGKVSSISTYPIAQNDGSSVYSVTIEFENPGAFTQGLTVGASVDNMHSPGYGKIELTESGSAKAEASGTISAVYYNNGDYVRAGATIATISGDSLTSQQRSIQSSETSVKNAELSMQETKDSLEDYSIKSPISGTVITKNAKAGDTLDRTNSSTALMVIADISKLKFSMEIDELDVSSVTEGQKVAITCDAIPNEEFEGTITSVSVEGTAMNGVTSYTAEVVIDEPKSLRPSMNIDASVIVNSAENVLMVPSADVKTAMGVSYVFLKDETGTRGATEEDFTNAMQNRFKEQMPEGMGEMPSGERPEGMGEMPSGERPEGMGEMPSGERPEGMGEMPSSERPEGMEGKSNEDKTEKENSDNEGAEKEGNQRSRLPEAPEGFVIAIVETGLTDDDYIEIKSGLKEGDQIQQLSASSTTTGMSMMMGGMGGGMPGGIGGGMPSGGGGGMPGGGGGGMPGGMR